ncbi:hypothetical protein ERO13_D11G340200v2 [Gossypium hirsutum]|uniref:Uncharacterized protein isoform X1 n=1 Tax=Gossypium hirsutum TaxID=3635 RepID=A0A1U8MUW3_GOSHI|nr:uncharacterized protein LOC107940444 isoform X1 [Gossypium hirsutum]KAG4123669.1 hypothetical protein ERO13_D11G340200v2 [Gossypium hirsutum]
MEEDAINFIIGRMISDIRLEIELLLNIKSDLDHLRNTMSAMEAVLRGAGERSATSNFTVRLKNPEDEEQPVTDYSFQRWLKVKKNLEIMPIDSSRTAFPEVRRSRMKMMEKMGYGMAKPEHQSMSNGSKKRFMNFVYDDFLRLEAERKKKQRDIRNWRQKRAKFYDDPTERGINNNGKITNWRCKWQRVVEMLLSVPKATNVGKTKASQQVLCHRNQMKMQWPIQSDPLVIIHVIQETDLNCNDAVLAEAKAERRLDRQRSEDFKEKARQLSYPKIFFPPPCKVKVTATDDKTREGVQSKFCDLENQIYDKGDYRVGCKDFPGLEQELKKTSWGKIPDYLESIAIQIEKDRGKTTDIFHIPTQVLLCAAIREMKDFSVGDLDLGTLKKWSATLNYAKKYGFQVGFADNLLKKNLLAYFAIQCLPKSIKI